MTQAAEGPLPGDRTAGPRAAALATPTRRQLWAWVWGVARPYVGWSLAALGALALFLGWYGVSGQALTAKQLPYLVSGGLTGIALVILAAVVLATDDVRRQLARLDEVERKIDDLYTLFVADLDAADSTRPGRHADADRRVALPAGTSYHRADCVLVAGKSEAVDVDRRIATRRKLTPCRVCDPPPFG